MERDREFAVRKFAQGQALLTSPSPLINRRMSRDEYTVIVSGERFTFTRDQLQSEPGNYFDTYFFGEFSEAANNARELRLQKEPLLFKIIQAHLRGYAPLPLPKSYVPYMTDAAALQNLLVDADFFGLQVLKELVQEEIERANGRLLVNNSCEYRLAMHYECGVVDLPIIISYDVALKYIAQWSQPPACQRCRRPSKDKGWKFVTCIKAPAGSHYEIFKVHQVLESKDI